MSKYADIEQIKEVIRKEWVKYMPSDLDINLSFVLGKIAEVPTIEVSEEELRKKYKEFYEQGKFDALVEVSEDCISREYLKSFAYINKGDFNSVETIREWIDNAPSVVPSRAEMKV